MVEAAGGIVSEKEISHSWKKGLGILFTLLAIIFGCLWYVKNGWGTFFSIMNWPFGQSWVDRTFSSDLTFMFPNGILNPLWGLLMCFPLYLRGFVSFKTLSIYTYISFVLNLLLFTVIAQLIFGASGTFTGNTMNTAFIASLVISWLGIRSVAGFGWLIVCILALVNLISAEYHLKHFGFFFILFTFSSLLFQTEFSPKNLFGEILAEFKGLKDEKLTFVKETMSEAVRTTGEGIAAGSKILL
jgi:hypothetical protein